MHFLLYAILFSTISLPVRSQDCYQTLTDSIGKQKILKGVISEKILREESSFGWMKTDISSYNPNPSLVKMIQSQKDSIHWLVFAGTWCEDSQFILPRFFKLLNVAGISSEKLSLIGVDRKKTTLGFLHAGFHIDRVPTIIILKKGKETGRVVEYGRYGNIDQDILEIVTDKYIQH